MKSVFCRKFETSTIGSRSIHNIASVYKLRSLCSTVVNCTIPQIMYSPCFTIRIGTRSTVQLASRMYSDHAFVMWYDAETVLCIVISCIPASIVYGQGKGAWTLHLLVDVIICGSQWEEARLRSPPVHQLMLHLFPYPTVRDYFSPTRLATHQTYPICRRWRWLCVCVPWTSEVSCPN